MAAPAVVEFVFGLGSRYLSCFAFLVDDRMFRGNDRLVPPEHYLAARR